MAGEESQGYPLALSGTWDFRQLNCIMDVRPGTSKGRRQVARDVVPEEG